MMPFPNGQPLAERLQATPEEWARFEGQAIGRVLDEDPPTEPMLHARPNRPLRLVSDGAPTPATPARPPPDSPDGAVSAQKRERVAQRAPTPTPAAGANPFEPLDTIVLPTGVLNALRQRSSQPR